MKSIAVASILAFSIFSANAAVSNSEREQAFVAISSVEALNGSDVADMRKFVFNSSEKELQAYMAQLAYKRDVQVDSPNEVDKQDLKAVMEKQSVVSLSKILKR